MKLFAYASGYRRLYITDEEELRALLGENARARGGGIGTMDPSDPRLHWWPSSVDFRQEALSHRSPTIGVADFRSLVAAIRRYGNLDEVWWFGHGASGELQFGGGQTLRSGDLALSQESDVSACFNPGGSITFVACNTGQRREFLQAISNAMRVPVVGFSTGIEWGVTFVGLPPHRRIMQRGIRGALPTRITVSPR